MFHNKSQRQIDCLVIGATIFVLLVVFVVGLVATEVTK